MGRERHACCATTCLRVFEHAANRIPACPYVRKSRPKQRDGLTLDPDRCASALVQQRDTS